ncbi:hypothetical protein C2R22_05215 [Salinigranum rubrum]|uniref:Recombinase RecA n=1 Tax=Salinigranum rubrum TaxID=755307 RepID=A0A2I8VGS9_9EURY|nr:hypothetical protein [Salinigranum rubrum]AUV81132.1 hypothetical protein C2R22_05215 [Salinigranum rubrum]
MSVEPHPDGGAPVDGYGFAPNLPVSPVARGTSLVVRGSAEADPSALAMRLLAPVTERDVGALLVETDDTQRGVTARWAAGTNVPRSRLAVVDCNGERRDSPDGLGGAGYVSRPSDLTGIGIKCAEVARSFVDGPRGRLRVGLDSVSTLLLYCDDVQAVYRFLHAFTGRIRTSGRLGVFVFNPEVHDPRVARVTSRPFDAAVDVRVGERGQREVRVDGVPGQTPAWTPL